LFSRYTSGVNLSKMTRVYIHYMASIVMADSLFWPEYPFKMVDIFFRRHHAS